MSTIEVDAKKAKLARVILRQSEKTHQHGKQHPVKDLLKYAGTNIWEGDLNEMRTMR